MRYLAIAQFRLLTTLRSSTAIFSVAILPPLLGAIAESTPQPQFLASADSLLGRNATIALFAWLFHALMIFAAGQALGSVATFRHDLTALPSDLMDSAPVSPHARFWGDALGVLGATAIIHACCLPVLAVVAALSPLPTRVFVWFEAAIIAMMILVSASAAWKRFAPRTKWSNTRGARSVMLFLVLLLLTLGGTTNREAFRDSFFGGLIAPSMRAWEKLTATIEDPVALIVLLTLLYAAYMVFFYISATRNPARA